MIRSAVARIWVYFLCCPQQLYNSNILNSRFFCAHTSLKLALEKELFPPHFVWSVAVTNSLEKGMAEVQGVFEHHPALGNAASVFAYCGQDHIKGRLGTFNPGLSNKKVFQ